MDLKITESRFRVSGPELLCFSSILGCGEGGRRVPATVAQSCPTLCDPVDCSPPGSSVYGGFQARELKWAATSSSRGSSDPVVELWISPQLAGGLFTTSAPGKVDASFFIPGALRR